MLRRLTSKNALIQQEEITALAIFNQVEKYQGVQLLINFFLPQRVADGSTYIDVYQDQANNYEKLFVPESETQQPQPLSDDGTQTELQKGGSDKDNSAE